MSNRKKVLKPEVKEALNAGVLENFFKESKYLKNKVLVKTFSEFIDGINSIRIKSHYEKSDINARSIKIALHNSKHVPLGDEEKSKLLKLFILHTDLLKGESFDFSKFVVQAKNLVKKDLTPEFNNMYIFIKKEAAEKAAAEKAAAEKAAAEKAAAEKAAAEKAAAEKAAAEKAAAEKAAAEKAAEGKDESLEEAEESEIVAKMAFDAIAKTLPSDPNSFYRLTKGAKNVAFEALARDLKCQQHHDSLEDLVKAFAGTSYEEIMEAKMESYSPILHRFEPIYGQVECPHDDL